MAMQGHFEVQTTLRRYVGEVDDVPEDWMDESREVVIQGIAAQLDVSTTFDLKYSDGSFDVIPVDKIIAIEFHIDNDPVEPF